MWERFSFQQQMVSKDTAYYNSVDLAATSTEQMGRKRYRKNEYFSDEEELDDTWDGAGVDHSTERNLFWEMVLRTVNKFIVCYSFYQWNMYNNLSFVRFLIANSILYLT